MSRRYDYVIPLQNRLNASHSDWSAFAKEDTGTSNRSLSTLPESLHTTVGLRLEQMPYSSQNCTYLLRHIDAFHAPLLRDLDITVTGGSIAPLFSHDSNKEAAARLQKLEEWRTWFAINGAPSRDAISNICNLNVAGYFYSRSGTEWTIYDLVFALLTRMPRLRTVDLSVSGLTRLPRPEIDFRTALPTFDEMEELTISLCSLNFVHALLSKMGARFKTLNIVGNLEPDVRDGPGIIDGHEDPGDRASVGSSSRGSTNASYLRPIDLVEVLHDLSSISQADGGSLRLSRLAIAPFMQPRHKKHAMRIAQAASLLVQLPFLSRLRTLILDRFIFSSLCAYADMYLAGNPSPTTVRNVAVILTRWTLRESDPDVYGEGKTSVYQAFGVLAKQIERRNATNLRRIQVMFHGSTSEISSGLSEIEEENVFTEFKVTCRMWRVRFRLDTGLSDEWM